MTAEAMARILVALELEHRRERPYDEQDPGHVIHPSGSIASSLDRRFLGAAAREVIDMYAPRTPKEIAVA